jgi:hypothetical protein
MVMEHKRFFMIIQMYFIFQYIDGNMDIFILLVVDLMKNQVKNRVLYYYAYIR